MSAYVNISREFSSAMDRRSQFPVMFEMLNMLISVNSDVPDAKDIDRAVSDISRWHGTSLLVRDARCWYHSCFSIASLAPQEDSQGSVGLRSLLSRCLRDVSCLDVVIASDKLWKNREKDCIHRWMLLCYKP
jgi:hypothetical protein